MFCPGDNLIIPSRFPEENQDRVIAETGPKLQQFSDIQRSQFTAHVAS